MFIKEDKDKFRFIDTDSDTITEILEPGIYDIQIHKSMFGKSFSFKRNDTVKPSKSKAESGVYKEALDSVTNFLDPISEEVRAEMGIANRMGHLYYGLPGTGKTYSALQTALEFVEKKDAIVLVTNEISEIPLVEITDMIRKSDNPNRLIVFIWDEFEKDYRNCDRTKLLGFLDGTESRDNIVVLATANDISKLPNTLLNRPGRFEKVLEFKIEDEIIRKTIIESMIPNKYKDIVSVEDVDNLCNEVKDISIDQIKVIVRDCIIYAIKNNKTLKEVPFKSKIDITDTSEISTYNDIKKLIEEAELSWSEWDKIDDVVGLKINNTDSEF